MAGHGYQIAMFAFGHFEDFLRRVAQRQHGLNRKPVAAKFNSDFFQIFAVVFHFLGFSQLELVEIPRHPAVGNVQQQQFRPGQPDQRCDVVQNDLVSRAVFQRNENVLIHVRYCGTGRPRCPYNAFRTAAGMKVSKSSFTFRMMMRAVVVQPRILSQVRFANSPILFFSPVKRINGQTAKPNCMLKTTWLATSSSVVLFSPKNPITQTAGTIAMSRVISRRSQGRSRTFTKPSMTTCPASVPVNVEFCPEASSATANKMLAPPTPSNGLNNL